jgi:dimethylglycine dehydrogenase
VGELPFMGCGQFRYRADPREGRTHLGSGRAGLRDQLQRDGDHIALRRALLEAGADGASPNTASTRSSLRLEKSFGIWSREFTQGYTPGETGMDRWIDWDKGDFIGRDAAMAERDAGGPGRVLVTLEVDAGRCRCQRLRTGLG